MKFKINLNFGKARYKVKGAMSQNANISVPLTFDKGLKLLLHDIWA